MTQSIISTYFHFEDPWVKLTWRKVRKSNYLLKDVDFFKEDYIKYNCTDCKVHGEFR